MDYFTGLGSSKEKKEEPALCLESAVSQLGNRRSVLPNLASRRMSLLARTLVRLPKHRPRAGLRNFGSAIDVQELLYGFLVPKSAYPTWVVEFSLHYRRTGAGLWSFGSVIGVQELLYAILVPKKVYPTWVVEFWFLYGRTGRGLRSFGSAIDVQELQYGFFVPVSPFTPS